MVKTPITRHSKPKRAPVTIDLDAEAVSAVNDEGAAKPYVGEPSHFDDAQIAGRPDVQPETVVNPGDLTTSLRNEEAPTSDDEPGLFMDEAKRETKTETVEADKLSSPSAAVTDVDADTPPAAEAKPFAYDFPIDDKPKPAPATSSYADAEPLGPIPAKPPKRSSLSLVTGGLIGGVAALALAGLLQYAGVLGYPGARVDAGPMTADIAALRSELDAIKNGDTGGETDAKVEGFAQALDQVKADVASLQQAVKAGSGGAPDASALQSFDARIKDIETAVAALGENAGAPSAADLTAITDRIAGVEALTKAAGDAGSAIDGRLGALEQSVAALSSKVDAQAGQPKIALAIASAALKSAIERGGPFQAEIETFAAIAPAAPELDALRAYAEKGVPTRADIAAQMDPAASAIIAAANPPSDNAGFFDRLLNSAESLVTVRPIGAVEGAGVPETVARIEVAVKAGDFAKALTEFETLPDASKSAGAAFADLLRARGEVERLTDQVIAGAMKAA